MKLFGLVLCVFFALCHVVYAQQPPPNTLGQLRDSLDRYHQRSEQRAAAYRASHPVIPTVAPGDPEILLVDVDRFGIPVYRMTFNSAAAKTTGANLLQSPSLTGFNITGRNMHIAVWDGGTVKEHIELGDRLVSTEGNTFSSHATHVTGTLIAKGIDPAARGMAPDAIASTYFFGNDLPVMSALAGSGQNSLLISNHSYGTGTGWVLGGTGWNWTGNAAISSVEDYRFGLYSARAMMIDQIAWLAPYYSIFWAAGNDRSDVGDGSRPADCNAGTGYDCIIPDAVAKNIITVGAVNKVPVYNSPSSVVMGNYSSWGPTDDGRIKPDLVAAGTDLYSLSATGTNTYEVMGGTSMSTPNASGSLLLVQQLYRDLHGGTFMKAATLKALAIHTAREAGPFPGPDYSHGWGLLDVASAAQHVMNDNGIDRVILERTLASGSTFEMPISPVAGKKLTVTIAWTDPAGSPPGELLDPTALALVNDLDVRIIDASAAEQKPWILDPLNPVRQAFRGDNFRDNVEKIEFNSPEARPYRIVVSHKGVLRHGAQDFSIIVSYQATSAPLTWYWIGNSGNWSNGSHWSASTGGPPANQVPAAGDRVVFDENSFTVPNAQVTLSSTVNIASLTWSYSGAATIQLAGQTLEINKELRVSALENFVTGGTVRFSSDSEGKISIQAGKPVDANIEVAHGRWNWQGSAQVGNMVLKSALHVTGSTVTVRNLSYVKGGVAYLTLTASSLVVNGKANLPQGLLLSGADSEIVIRSIVENHVLDALAFDGTLVVEGIANLAGKGNIRRLLVKGKCVLLADNSFSLLELGAGSELSLASGSTQSIDSLAIRSTQALRTRLGATSAAFLWFRKNARYCFDYLDVNSVSVLFGSVSAGLNSTLTNAQFWQTVPCGQMDYADFTWEYACANSLISFKDLSTGSPEGWDWSMTGGVLTNANGNATFRDQNPYYSFSMPGVYPVQLTIVKGNVGVAQTRKNVVVAPNHLPANSIIPDARVLLSRNPGTKYQWLRNGEPIAGAVSRSYEFDGVPGSYQVAAYDEFCNSISEPYVISGVEEDQPAQMVVSPNPARSEVMITGIGRQAKVSAISVLGAEGELVSMGQGRFCLEGLTPGLYILRVVDRGISTSHRVMVTR